MARHKRKVDPDSVFGRADTVVITGKSGGFKRTVHSKKELNDFFGFLKNNNISAKNYDYEVVPTSNTARSVDGTKSAVGGVKKLVQRRTHTRLDKDQVFHGGTAAERFGEDLVKPKSSSNKLMDDVR